MKNKNLTIAIWGIAFLAGAVFLFSHWRSNGTRLRDSSQLHNTTDHGEASGIDESDLVRSATDELIRAASQAELAGTTWTELRSRLLSMSPESAVSAISEFLKTGKDTSTGLDFVISNRRDGSLESAPSLRVAALDLLGKISPQLAGPPSESILSDPVSPDEWAVAMRNVAKAYPGEKGRAILREKSIELLTNSEWIDQPTSGFFHAFDSVVYTEHTEAIPHLAALFQLPDRNDLGHAGFLTLDRLTLVRTKDALRELLGLSQLQKSNGPMVANLFARADVRDPGQAEILAKYLTAPHRTAQELETWAGVYPNGNYIHSANLLTTTQTRKRDDLVDHDAKALTLISKWLTEPRFREVRPVLQTAQNRLNQFVLQASRPDPKP